MHAVTVSQVVNSATSLPVAPGNITVTPSAPVFQPATVDGQGNLVVTGKGEPKALITFYANGKSVGTTVADVAGNFVFKSPLAAGVYAVTGTQTVSGLTSPRASAGSVTIPLKTPTVSPAVLVNGNEAQVTGSSAEPGATITIYSDGVPVGTTTADANGGFVITSSALTPGLHAITIKQSTVAGRSPYRSRSRRTDRKIWRKFRYHRLWTICLRLYGFDRLIVCASKLLIVARPVNDFCLTGWDLYWEQLREKNLQKPLLGRLRLSFFFSLFAFDFFWGV